MSSLIEISAAFMQRLQGLSVVEDNQAKAVPVIAGLPVPQFQRKQYPAFSVDLAMMEPALDREDTEPDYFAKDPVAHTIREKELPQAWDLTYQVDCFSRYPQHADTLLEYAMRQIRRPDRGQYLEISPTTLLQDAFQGDQEIQLTDPSAFFLGGQIILDRRIPPDSRLQQQAFYVMGVATNGFLRLDRPLELDFPAAVTQVYKGRYDLILEGPQFTDQDQDGGVSYSRRILRATVWASLDLGTMVTRPGVSQVCVNWKPDSSLLTQLAVGSPYA